MLPTTLRPGPEKNKKNILSKVGNKQMYTDCKFENNLNIDRWITHMFAHDRNIAIPT